jgi:hypothetical protein
MSSKKLSTATQTARAACERHPRRLAARLTGPEVDEDLVVHELCHVWQFQHRAVRVWLSYARPSTFTRDRTRYRANRYEREARYAVEATRPPLDVG